jgi:carboxymethylenebutenolidase
MKRIMLFAVITSALVGQVNAQDWARERLDKSPRHGEWVKLEHGARKVEAFVVFPEVRDKATAVIVIHEIYGLTDWVRGVADQLAEAGYIAIAPDLLSGTGPKGGGTAELTKDSVVKTIRDLPPDQITADLNACVAHVTKLPACNGKVAVGGFCWGGSQTFRYATNNNSLKAAFAFYGGGPEKAEDISRITCPVYGFYGENDARVNASIPKSKELMKAAGKTYDPVVYTGAGHGFMRAGESPDAKADDKKAREDAWKRWKELLKIV